MAFTQQNLNYTTEYSKAMANAYPYWSYFADLYGSPNSATYKPISGKAVAVQSMTVAGAKAVDRNNLDGQFTRNFNTDQQILTMTDTSMAAVLGEKYKEVDQYPIRARIPLR